MRRVRHVRHCIAKIQHSTWHVVDLQNGLAKAMKILMIYRKSQTWGESLGLLSAMESPVRQLGASFKVRGLWSPLPRVHSARSSSGWCLSLPGSIVGWAEGGRVLS